MKAMTYGVLPEIEEFEDAFAEKQLDEGGYSYDLRGEDADAAEAAGIDTQASDLDAHALYEVIEKLTAAWEEGNDAAGDLAAGFLSTLGFEWI